MSGDARDGVRRALLALDGLDAAMSLGVKWSEAEGVRETVIEALREDGAALLAEPVMETVGIVGAALDLTGLSATEKLVLILLHARARDGVSSIGGDFEEQACMTPLMANRALIRLERRGLIECLDGGDGKRVRLEEIP